MTTLTMQEIVKIEQDLIAQGWTRQFTVFPDRVREFVELYESSGYEVRIEPWAITTNADPSCDSCALIGIMRTIFTKKKSETASS